MELKSIVVDDIKKEIIAFANCEGGKLYIGVQDDGTIIGVEDPDGTALQISNMVRDAIKPDLTMFLHYETLNEMGNRLLLLIFSKEQNGLIMLQKRIASRRCVCSSGIFVCTGYQYCNPPYDQGDRRRPF